VPLKTIAKVYRVAGAIQEEARDARRDELDLVVWGTVFADNHSLQSLATLVKADISNLRKALKSEKLGKPLAARLRILRETEQ